MIVDERKQAGSGSTMAYMNLIDHEGHIEVLISSPSVGDCIPIPLNLTVAPKAKREFVVWFRSQIKDCEILYLTGRLLLHLEGCAPVISNTLEIEIHEDSWEWKPERKAARSRPEPAPVSEDRPRLALPQDQ